LTRSDIAPRDRQKRAGVDSRRLLGLRQLHHKIILKRNLVNTESVTRARRRNKPLKHRAIRQRINTLSGPTQNVLKLINDLRRNSNTEVPKRLLPLIIGRPQNVPRPLLSEHLHQPPQQVRLTMRQHSIRAGSNDIKHQMNTTLPDLERSRAAPNFTTP